MLILKNGKYAIHTITNIFTGEQDISYGVAIHPINQAYVIAFAKYNEKEECAELESACNRILDIPAEDWDIFRKTAQLAINLVEVANLRADE